MVPPGVQAPGRPRAFQRMRVATFAVSLGEEWRCLPDAWESRFEETEDGAGKTKKTARVRRVGEEARMARIVALLFSDEHDLFNPAGQGGVNKRTV